MDRVLEGLAEGDLEVEVLALGERVGGGERLAEGHMEMEKEGERVRGEERETQEEGEREWVRGEEGVGRGVGD